MHMFFYSNKNQLLNQIFDYFNNNDITWSFLFNLYLKKNSKKFAILRLQKINGSSNY